MLTFNATHGLNLAIHSLVRPGARCSCRGMSTTPSPVPWPPSRSCACGWFRRRCSAPTSFWRPGAPAEPGGGCGDLHPRLQRVRLCAAGGGGGKPVPAAASAADCGRLPVGGGDAGDHAGMGGRLCGHAWAQEPVWPPGHRPAALPGGGRAPAPGGHRQPLTPAGDARLSAGPVGGGTHNVPGAAGLLEGLRFLRRRGIAAIRRQETALVAQLARGLDRLPGVQVYAAWEKGCQTGVLSFRVAHRDPGGWPTPSASGAWRCGRGFTAPRWPCHRRHRGHRHRAGQRFCLQHQRRGGTFPQTHGKAGIETNKSALGFRALFSQEGGKIPRSPGL